MAILHTKFTLSEITILCVLIQGYIRFRESGCVEALLQSEGPPDVVFSGVQGKCELVGKELRRWTVSDLVHLLSQRKMSELTT